LGKFKYARKFLNILESVVVFFTGNGRGVELHSLCAANYYKGGLLTSSTSSVSSKAA
jgi:hypothetical protein